MRDLIIDTIIKNFDKGYDEMGIGMIIYAREDRLIEDSERAIIHKNLKTFCIQTTDEELLLILDSQACQRYR